MSKQFIIHQCYEVTVDKSPIDKVNYSETDLVWSKERKARFHRMLQAIISDEKALQAVFEYKVIVNYGIDHNDSAEEMLEAHYGKGLEFAHILANFAHIFAQEDGEWLLNLIKDYAEVEAKMTPNMSEEDYDHIEYFDLCVQTDDLEHCFQVGELGWNMSTLPSNCEGSDIHE